MASYGTHLYTPIQAIGPASDLREQDFFDGYNPPSRNGEVVANAYIDAFLWNEIIDTTGNKWRYHGYGRLNDPDEKHKYIVARAYETENVTEAAKMVAQDGEVDPAAVDNLDKNPSFEYMQTRPAPGFHEFASAQVGTIAVSSNKRAQYYRHQIAAETAHAVMVCGAKRCSADHNRFTFSGVVRTRSTRKRLADGEPKSFMSDPDDHFTLTLQGMVQMVNNGKNEIHQGDEVEWCFFDDNVSTPDALLKNRKAVGPDTIIIRKATSSARIFGRAMSNAVPGQLIDVLVQPK